MFIRTDAAGELAEVGASDQLTALKMTVPLSFQSVSEFIRTIGWPGLLVMSFALVAILGPWLAPQNALTLHTEDPNLPPFRVLNFPLGTDQLGRDLLSRVIVGARLSFLISVVPVASGGLIGMILGGIAGVAPRFVAVLIMRLTDIGLAFPSILLALALVAVRGPGFSSAVLALSIVLIAPMTRVARGVAIDVGSRPYIEAARLAGAGTLRIVWDFVLPNMLPTLLIFMTTACGGVLLFGAGLSFLGAGAQPPDVEWGRMVADGRNVLLINAWPSILPGLFIFVISLGFNRLGDRLRDRFDPRWQGM